MVLRLVNVNWNANYGDWNVNAYKVDNGNEWNAKRHVFSRNYCRSPAPPAGVLFIPILFEGLCRPFFHPPSCRPIASSWEMRSEYFSLRISLLSHAICRKNFAMSRCEMVCESMTIFSEGGRYADLYAVLKAFRNDASIL